MFQLRKKTIALTTAAFVLAGGGAAFAYWTTSGAGSSGNIQNGASNGALALTAEFTSGIAPGGERTVTFKATNAGTTDLRLESDIHAEISTDVPGCLASWFSIADVPASLTVPGGTISPMTIGTGTLKFKNEPTVLQDDCKSANVKLALTTVPPAL